MWVPMRINSSNADRQSHYLYVLGRLKPGSRSSSERGMTVLAGQLEHKLSKDEWRTGGANRIPLHRQLVGDCSAYIQVSSRRSASCC